MKTLRQIHLYLGCIFAPLIIYFSLSGAWQIFRLNDIPKDRPASEPPSLLRSVFHELSKPHTNSTLPGESPKTAHSEAFMWASLLMGFGMIATTFIGIVLAWRYSRSPKNVLICIGIGIALPIFLLFLH